jgi:alcohol dehydrogenase, propanol-preferring
MLAARYYQKAKNVVVEDVPVPSIGKNEVLVKIGGIGVCHSDLHLVNDLIAVPKYPITLGHEGAGTVEKIGENVKDIKVGDRVALFYLSVCGECEYCITGRENLCDKLLNLGFEMEGTWAEYVKVPASSVIKLPDQIPFEQAALAGCAVVTPFHANFEGNVQPNKSVAIIGIGGVGFHGLEWSRIFGGAPIIAVDINDEKLKRAKNAGADYTVNAKNENPIEAIRRLTGGTGAEVVFEYIGNKQTMETAIKSTKKGGRTVMVGITPSNIEYNALDLLNNGQTITVCQNHTRDQLKAVLRLMVLGRIDIGKSITARHPLKEAAKAVDELNTQSNNPTRIVLIP